MPAPEIVPATLEHATAMAPRMREADRQEIWAASMLHPETALRQAVMCSRHPQAGLIDGEIACLFGVVPQSTLSGTGAAWMLGTDLIAQHPALFLRHCGPAFAEMAQGFRYLHNWVDARNTKAVRWLRRLGFTVHDPEPYGPFGLPFHHFEIRLHV